MKPRTPLPSFWHILPHFADCNIVTDFEREASRFPEDVYFSSQELARFALVLGRYQTVFRDRRNPNPATVLWARARSNWFYQLRETSGFLPPRRLCETIEALTDLETPFKNQDVLGFLAKAQKSLPDFAPRDYSNLFNLIVRKSFFLPEGFMTTLCQESSKNFDLFDAQDLSNTLFARLRLNLPLDDNEGGKAQNRAVEIMPLMSPWESSETFFALASLYQKIEPSFAQAAHTHLVNNRLQYKTRDLAFFFYAAARARPRVAQDFIRDITAITEKNMDRFDGKDIDYLYGALPHLKHKPKDAFMDKLYGRTQELRFEMSPDELTQLFRTIHSNKLTMPETIVSALCEAVDYRQKKLGSARLRLIRGYLPQQTIAQL